MLSVSTRPFLGGQIYQYSCPFLLSGLAALPASLRLTFTDVDAGGSQSRWADALTRYVLIGAIHKTSIGCRVRNTKPKMPRLRARTGSPRGEGQQQRDIDYESHR